MAKMIEICSFDLAEQLKAGIKFRVTKICRKVSFRLKSTFLSFLLIEII